MISRRDFLGFLGALGLAPNLQALELLDGPTASPEKLAAIADGQDGAFISIKGIDVSNEARSFELRSNYGEIMRVDDPAGPPVRGLADHTLIVSLYNTPQTAGLISRDDIAEYRRIPIECKMSLKPTSRTNPAYSFEAICSRAMFWEHTFREREIELTFQLKA